MDLRNSLNRVAENGVSNIIQNVQDILDKRWKNRCAARISEAGFEYNKKIIYDPEHAERKMYDAYQWVYDHVSLKSKLNNDAGSREVSFYIECDEDNSMDSYRYDRTMEVVDDLIKQSSYSFH